MPITSRAENLLLTDSTALAMGDRLQFLAAEFMFSRPLADFSKLRLFLSLSSVDIVVLTLDSKFLLSNCIDTTRSSTVLLIT